MRIPIFGPGLNAKSPFVTAKKMTNIYAEQRPQGEKAAIVGYGTPGVNLFMNFGATPPRGGLEFEANSVAYVVHRGTLWEINNAGVGTNRGSLNTTTGRVSMAHNGSQVMIVDGTNGYIYSTVAVNGTPQNIASITRVGTIATMTTSTPHLLVTGNMITVNGTTPAGFNGYYTVTVTSPTTLTYNMIVDPGGNATIVSAYTINTFLQIYAAGFNVLPNPTTVTFLAGQFVVNYFGAGRFYVSGNANIAYDGLYWDALQFANAETNPDPIQAIWSGNGQLYCLGTQTTEFWGKSGALDFPFAQINGSATEWGLAATWSIAKYDNTFACLMKNRMGQVMIAKMAGYVPQKISTPDIDSIINSYVSTSDATSYSYSLGGHPMYVISFPSAGFTWLYDGSTSMWSPLTSNGLTRHLANFAFTLLNNKILADYATGNLYILSATALTDNGYPITRELISENIAQPDLTRLTVDKVRLDIEVGVGLTIGQGSDPQIELSISRDNGKTWSVGMLTSIGKIGDYKRRVEWRRLGTAREFTFKFRITDPVQVTIISACINPED